jgi:hypothetical protein
MTETEWLARHDYPLAMLDQLRGKATDRKLVLFLVAYCRHLWSWFTDERSRRAVEIAERYADGLASLDEVRRAEDLAYQAIQDLKRRAGDRAWIAADGAYITASAPVAELGTFQNTYNLVSIVDALDPERSARVCELLREVFGNPYRLSKCDPSWQTTDVIALATAVYADRAFDRLPLPADALTSAGCDSPEVLTHCRSPGSHVRGCWAVDLILGQE